MSLPEHTDDGENKDGTISGESAEESDSTADGSGQPADVAPGTKESERGEIKTGQELLTEHAEEMLDVLVGKSVKNNAMRITCAVGKVRDLQRAIEENKLFDPPPSVVTVHEPPQPPILGAPVPEPDPGSMEHLRQRISTIADTDEIEEVLKTYLTELAQPLLEHHA
jgi:hypothetical protein